MTTISRTRLTCLMGAALAMVAAIGWLATGAFPLAAAPQMVDDAAGVAVNMNGSALLHRSSVPYPATAIEKGIEGTVVVQVKLDANGEVSDATVLSGPDELRKAVLQSVLSWHFDKSAALGSKTINIDFVKPVSVARPALVMDRSLLGGLPTTTTSPLAPPPPTPPGPPLSGKVDRIVVTGLSDSARAELVSSLPIQEGGEWSGTAFAEVRAAVNKFDTHLIVALQRSGSGELSLRIGVPNSGLPAFSPASAPITFTASNIAGAGGRGAGSGFGSGAAAAPLPAGVFSVGNGTTPPTVLSKVDPQYTESARAAKYEGTVMLSVVVNADGKAEDVQVVKSLGMGLDEQAVACIQQWVFRPGRNQGIPVKVRAQIEINFKLL